MRSKPKEDTIVFSFRHACDDIDNNQSRKSYTRGAVAFGEYLRGEGINKVSKIPEGQEKALLQGFADKLQGDGKRPATIHTYMAGACHCLSNIKGVHYSLGDIEKPQRAESQKGRDPIANRQGRQEAVEQKYSRLIDFAGAVGIRRAEYEKLDGRSLKPDESGYMCIWVKGKGGKVQAQRILPYSVPVVNKTMQDIQGREKVFSKQEMNQKIDLHSIRRQVARTAYEYYKHRIDTEQGYKEKLQGELIRRYDAMHPTGRANDETTREKYIKEIYGNEYKCRGANAQALRDQKRGTKFDRLPLMAVSVFHLSHWRSDVTVKNYMI